MTTRAAAALCVAAGLLAAAAFAPLSAPFASVAGVALLVFVLRATPSGLGTTLGLGLCFGVPFMFGLLPWMRAVSWPGYVAVASFESLCVAFVVVGLRLVAPLAGWPVWTAAVWTAGEWLRGSFPLGGLPWGRLAATAIETPLAPWVRYVGMASTSFLIVLVAALGVAALSGTRRAARLVAGVTAIAITLLGLVLPVGVAHPVGTRHVALIQGDIPGRFLTWPYGDILLKHLSETRDYALRVVAGRTARPDLVLWPENATDVDPYASPQVRTRIEQLAGLIGAPILVGGVFNGSSFGKSSTKAVNAGVIWSTSGPGDRYIKRRPVPFGEYVPLRSQLGHLVPQFNRDIPRDMVAGTKPGILHAAGTTWGDTICFDIADDKVVLAVASSGVLVVQTSNAAFSGTAQPAQQWDISRMRAIEAGRQVLVPSTNGISGVIDATGAVLQQAPTHRPETIVHDVTLGGGRTPAMMVGRWLELLWIATAVGALAAGARRRQT